MGSLNKLAGAPGSIGDLASGGVKYNTLPAGHDATPVGAVAPAPVATAWGIKGQYKLAIDKWKKLLEITQKFFCFF